MTGGERASGDEAQQQQQHQEQQHQEQHSALQANIAAKKDLAYYFAHKQRETGEPPAPLPVPQVLHVEVRQADEALQLETITTYQFLDDGDRVKVYVPLEGLAGIGAESVSSRCAVWRVWQARGVLRPGRQGAASIGCPRVRCLLSPRRAAGELHAAAQGPLLCAVGR
jgi:hypothetical protein